MHPELFIAGRAVVELDRWLPAEVAKLAAIESELKAYAAEHKLDYLLP